MQFHAKARRGGFLRPGERGRRRRRSTVTRLVDDACIFLNRPGFAGGVGCALHIAALEAGERPLDWKPNVCWQVPLRLEHSTDENGHLTSRLREWKRRDWGEGGAEFHWWCTESPRRSSATEPVYESSRDEIVELVGQRIYDTLVAQLERPGWVPLPHPALREAVALAAVSRRRRCPRRRTRRRTSRPGRRSRRPRRAGWWSSSRRSPNPRSKAPGPDCFSFAPLRSGDDDPSSRRAPRTSELTLDASLPGRIGTSPPDRHRRCMPPGRRHGTVDVDQAQAALAVERQCGVPVHQAGDAVAEQFGPPAVGQAGVGSPRSTATRSARVASSAVSIRASRATWLTHADTSVTAGRFERSSSSTASGTGGGRRPPAATAAGSPGRCGPGGGARRPPGPGPARRCVVGWRWAMPRMARSGSTWRTGVSVAAASRSRHAATAWATARARDRSDGRPSAEPALGVDRARRAGAQLLARLLDPAEPAELELGDETVVQLEQRGHVGGGVAPARR